MMVTNSVFSVLSPYLWLGDVFSKNDLLIKFYSASATLFYSANTFFACLVLWVLYHFGINSSRNELATIVNTKTAEDTISSSKDDMSSMYTSSNSQNDPWRKRRPSRYLAHVSNDLRGESSLLENHNACFRSQSKELQRNKSIVQEIVNEPPSIGLMNPSTDLPDEDIRVAASA